MEFAIEVAFLILRLVHLPDVVASFSALTPTQKLMMGVVMVVYWTQSLDSKKNAPKKK